MFRRNHTRTMKTKITAIITAGAMLAITSCTTQSIAAGPNTKRDAAAGAVIGGVGGAIIGHQSGETAEGALLGAALGGLAGGIIGSERDKQVGFTSTHY